MGAGSGSWHRWDWASGCCTPAVSGRPSRAKARQFGFVVLLDDARNDSARHGDEAKFGSAESIKSSSRA